MKIDIIKLRPVSRSLPENWTIVFNEVYLPPKLSPYEVKKKIWKAKQNRKRNIKKIMNSNGELSLCTRCNGLGFIFNDNFPFCRKCDSLGIIDWIRRVTRN